MKNFTSLLLLIMALTALAACGEEKAATGGTTSGGTTAAGSAVEVKSGQAAENIYVPATLEVAAGEAKVTFNNVSAQPHNWTLVKQGDEEKADAEAMKDTTNYSYAGAIAQTKLLQAGGKETITFKAEPGTYTYLCTFPGHYVLGMKGTLTIK